MLETIRDMPPGIDGLRAVGKLSKDDYEKVMVPLLDDAKREGRRVRFLYQLGPDFEGLSAGGALEDAKIGLHYMKLFDACAVVTDHGWIGEAIRLASFMIPCAVRVFGEDEQVAATDWLASLPHESPLTYRLLSDRGVIVVELKRALSAGDFDALTLTADEWIESHGSLRGLVIHAHEFPGWESFASFVRHIRFVRNHHHKIQRIALALDGKLAALAPPISEHFVHAEVKGFGYNEIASAIAWAAGENGKLARPDGAPSRSTG